MPLVFPELLTLEIFAPLVMRLALGAFFIAASVNRLSNKERVETEKTVASIWPRTARAAVWYTGIVELIIGILFVIGLFSQIAGIVGAIYAAKMIVLREMKPGIKALANSELFTYILILASSVAIVFLGAGALAFDLPL